MILNIISGMSGLSVALLMSAYIRDLGILHNYIAKKKVSKRLKVERSVTKGYLNMAHSIRAYNDL